MDSTPKANCKPSGVPFTVEHFNDLADDVGLTPRETTMVLRIGMSTYWAWAAQGRIKVRRIGRTSRTTAGEIRRVIAAGP